jgi:hypothetical protein
VATSVTLRFGGFTTTTAGCAGAAIICAWRLALPRAGCDARGRMHQQNLDHNSNSGVGIAQKGPYLLGTIDSGSHAINAKRL